MTHTAAAQTLPPKEAIRLVPVMHLQTGETVILLAETNMRYEERVAFGPAALAAECASAATPSPSTWLAEHIEAVANHAHNWTEERPVIVSAPIAAFMQADIALACDMAIRRTKLCPQEICIEISDAELALPSKEIRRNIEALRKKGFRVSLNATRSCETPLSSALRLLLDSIRIDARNLETESELEARIEAAQACGMSVIAENASWRDGAYLADMGIEYAIRPRTDA